MNHTSYELSKALKEFLKDSAPEPIMQVWWDAHPPQVERLIGPDAPHTGWDRYKDNGSWRELMKAHNMIPAYTLEDILSKPFCEALIATKKVAYCGGDILNRKLANDFYYGNFPAVEKELWRLIKGGKDERI